MTQPDVDQTQPDVDQTQSAESEPGITPPRSKYGRFGRESLESEFTVELAEDRDLTADEQAILDIHKGWLLANRVGDNDWVNAALSEDAIMCNTNGGVYRGRAHWAALWDLYRLRVKGDKRTGGRPPLMTSQQVVLRVNGDMGWISYRSKFVGKRDGNVIPTQARGTEVYERLSDGWRMVHGHFSYGAPGTDGGGL